MTATYVAWNGQHYAWPPPEGWYEATDGRWWAPGTGPGPAVAAPPPGSPDPGPSSPGSAHPGHSAPGAVDSGPSSYAPTNPAEAPYQGQTPQPTVLTGPQAASQTTALPGYGHPGPPGGGYAANDRIDFGDTPQPRGSGTSRFGLLIGVAVFAALLAGGLFLVLRDRDTTTGEVGAGTEADAPLEETTAPAPPSSEPTTTPPTTVAPPSTAAGDTAAGAGDTTGAADDEKAARFREVLAQSGLDNVDLDDQEILAYAPTLCLLAASAPTLEAYTSLRDSTVAGTATGLDADQLNVVIDAAVIAFCPEDAERIGLTVGP